ncbi:MAG: peptidylprolyl isomerase [Lachnospiraceae bacterium]
MNRNKSKQFELNKWERKKTLQNQNRWTKRVACLLLACIMGSFLLTGCEKINRDTKIVLTAGFTEDEIFRIETASCYKKEVMVYLTNIQNQYEQVYGPDIWNVSKNGVTLEDNIKESVLAQLAQIKTMNLMAQNYGVELEKEEKQQIEEVAEIYYDSLNETEKEQMDVTLSTITQLYTEYAIADKVYRYLIQDVNPEISDDEARTITVEQILIRTTRQDGSGNTIAFSEEEKEEAYRTCAEIQNRLRDGEEFEVLASYYNQAEADTISFGKGEVDSVLETAGFNLGNGEVSGILETKEGYYILKCISTFNREETDANKIKIVEERKKEIFNQEYDTFVKSLTRNMNKQLWDEVTLIRDPEVKTSDFFEVYDENCTF